MSHMRMAAAAVTLSLLALHSATAAAADRIWQKSGGRPLTADVVTQDHYDLLKYRKGSTELELPGDKIKAVDYGDAPESFELAQDRRAEGDLENAISLFKASMAEKGVRPWIRVLAPYEMGETYRLWGARERSRFADAVRSYDEALAAEPKTRLRPDILYGRAMARLGAGELEAALSDLDTLKQEAYDNKYGVTWELKASYEKAQALDEAGRVEDAKRAFSKLETDARSFAGQAALTDDQRALATEMAGLARLEQGRVLTRDGKAADAERFFADIVRDTREAPGVRAAALVGQGEALRAQKKLKEAQLMLARARVLYYPATEAVAEATYLLGEIAEELGAAEPKGSRLAQDYFREVAERFSGSRWAQKAQEKVN